MTTIEEVMANLDSDARSEFTVGTGLTSRRIKTPSVALNAALGGGFGQGRVVTITGTKSAGKSALCLQIVAMAQQEDLSCAWIDAEKSFESDWAERLGVDTEKLIVSKAADMNKAGNLIRDLCKANTDVIVIDSGSALIQPSYFGKTKKNKNPEIDMENTAKIGSFASSYKALLRTANYYNRDTLIIVIMQETMKDEGYAWVAKPEGGQASEYYTSQLVRLLSNNGGNIITGTRTIDGREIDDEPIGRKVRWFVEFNKIGPQKGHGEYEFYFVGDNVGIDDKLELLTTGLKFGIVEKAGAWYKYNDEAIQGEEKFVQALRDSPEMYEELKERVELVL